MESLKIIDNYQPNIGGGVENETIIYDSVNDKIWAETPYSYDFVDLGLSVKWATCNIGARKPEEYGWYFAWGETDGYITIDVTNGVKTFSWDDYKYCNGTYSTLTKYCNNSSYGADGFTDSLITLESSDDAATVSDNTYRMPTKAELEELTANTTSTWETLNGVNGRRFTASNGNSIFVPAAGSCSDGSVGSSLLDVGSYGCLWSGSLDENFPNFGLSLYFVSYNVIVGSDIRCDGLSVRPVQDK